MQARVRAANVKDAATLSAAAEPKVLSLLDAALQSGQLKGLWVENLTSAALLDVLRWEYRHQSILHNGPLRRGATLLCRRAAAASRASASVRTHLYTSSDPPAGSDSRRLHNNTRRPRRVRWPRRP